MENIRAHVRPLTERLQKELPPLGYPSITPKGTESPVVTFTFKDAARTRARLERAGIIVTLRTGADGNQMRVSPSIYNNQADIDKLIQALG